MILGTCGNSTPVEPSSDRHQHHVKDGQEQHQDWREEYGEDGADMLCANHKGTRQEKPDGKATCISHKNLGRRKVEK